MDILFWNFSCMLEVCYFISSWIPKVQIFTSRLITKQADHGNLEPFYIMYHSLPFSFPLWTQASGTLCRCWSCCMCVERWLDWGAGCPGSATSLTVPWTKGMETYLLSLSRRTLRVAAPCTTFPFDGVSSATDWKQEVSSECKRELPSSKRRVMQRTLQDPLEGFTKPPDTFPCLWVPMALQSLLCSRGASP